MAAAEGGPGAGVLERLDESECLQLIGAGRVERLAYTGRFGPTVLPVLYKLHEGSVVFHTLADTFTEEDLRTGIANAEYQVAFEVDQYDPEPSTGGSCWSSGRRTMWTPRPSAPRSATLGRTRGPRLNRSTWSWCSPRASAAAADSDGSSSSLDTVTMPGPARRNGPSRQPISIWLEGAVIDRG